jgi:hypothetical protein
MKYINLSEIPSNTWQAIAVEDLDEFSEKYRSQYFEYLMLIISDKILKSESIDFKLMEGKPDAKEAAKLIKEWQLCKPISYKNGMDIAQREGIDQCIAISKATLNTKPIRTIWFDFFQKSTPTPKAFLSIDLNSKGYDR